MTGAVCPQPDPRCTTPPCPDCCSIGQAQPLEHYDIEGEPLGNPIFTAGEQ